MDVCISVHVDDMLTVSPNESTKVLLRNLAKDMAMRRGMVNEKIARILWSVFEQGNARKQLPSLVRLSETPSTSELRPRQTPAEVTGWKSCVQRGRRLKVGSSLDCGHTASAPSPPHLSVPSPLPFLLPLAPSSYPLPTPPPRHPPPHFPWCSPLSLSSPSLPSSAPPPSAPLSPSSSSSPYERMHDQLSVHGSHHC